MDILSLEEFAKLSFNIYLPKRNTQCRMELSKRIQDLGGKTTFKIAKGVILIIDSERELSSYDILSNIKDFDIVYLYEKDLFKVYKSKESIKISDNNLLNDLRIIFYDDIVRVLERIEKVSLIYQYYHGLSRTANNSNVISLVIKKNEFGGVKYINKCMLFEKIENGMYDFPKYIQDVAEGFSIFMTKKEKEFVDSLVIRRSLCENKQKSLETKEINTFKPKKEHNLCYICRMKYESYKEHITSPLHKLNIEKTRPSYEYLKEVFNSLQNIKIQKKEMLTKTSIPLLSPINVDKCYNEKNIFISKKQENVIEKRRFEVKDYFADKEISNLDRISIKKELLNNPFLSKCNINNLNLYIENENKSKNLNINLNVNIYSRENEKTKSKKSLFLNNTQKDSLTIFEENNQNKDERNKSKISVKNLYKNSFNQVEKENNQNSFSIIKDEKKVKDEETENDIKKDYRKKRFYSKISPDYLLNKTRLKFRKNNFDKLVENLEKFKHLFHS